MTSQRRARFVIVGLTAMLFAGDRVLAGPSDRRPVEIQFRSSADQSSQPALAWIPAGDEQPPKARPLLVMLHSWSGNWKQDNVPWLAEAQNRGWIYLHPDFRGRNDRPEACGSKLARQDVLDCIQWAIQNHRVDESRIYLAGVSGGGHMAMLMAARHPERFSAVSTWVGISDLAEWHRFHSRDGREGTYATMTAACCGGPPGASMAVDAEYRDRSSIFWLQNVGQLPVEFSAGVDDGKTGSVPVSHSLHAFNVIAKASGHPIIGEEEMAALWSDGRLKNPGPHDTPDDPAYARAILLRRTAGPSRVTIFEGGHEGLPAAACRWLERHTRPTHLQTTSPDGNSTP